VAPTKTTRRTRLNRPNPSSSATLLLPSLSCLRLFISPASLSLFLPSSLFQPPSSNPPLFTMLSTSLLALVALAASATAQSGYGRFSCTIVNGDLSFSPGKSPLLASPCFSSSLNIPHANASSYRPYPVRGDRPRLSRCQRRLCAAALSFLAAHRTC
jgi:hypothetical protein